MSVTSSATATTLISERSGRYTRLASTILFIMKFLRLATIPRLVRIHLVQVHHLRSRRLLQNKLIVLEGFVQLQLHHGERDVIFFLRPVNADLRRKRDCRIVLVVLVGHVRDQVTVLVVDKLAVRK